ncbi:MAG: alpha-amylase family glycosyl hydrolase [Anaeromyxobacter sp.]
MPRRLVSLLALLLAAGCATTGTRGATASGPASAAGALAPKPDRWQHDEVRGAVFYQIFIRSFSDSDGDGTGDLKGLIARLDYLNDGDPKTTTDLGVDGIWLTPIFHSYSYHGYDTASYELIARDLGQLEDFERLCAEAHKRGIKVVLDLVLNHTSFLHPWFLEALISKNEADWPHHDWYVWRTDDPGWEQPFEPHKRTWRKVPSGLYYYTLFFGMPDLNLRNPEVRKEAKYIAKLWLDRGADGYRLDAAKHAIEGPDGEQQDTPETHAWWREFSADIRAHRPDALLFGENWSGTDQIAPYYGDVTKVAGGDELPASFDFPLSERILDGLQTGSAQGVAAKLDEIGRVYPPGVLDAPFLTNHDQLRVATQLKGDAGKLRTAAAVLLTLPGIPFIYYGEELGLRQVQNGDDEFKRTPFPWDGSETGGFTTGKPWFKFAPGKDKVNVAAETGDPASLLSRYRNLIRLRHGSDALMRGELAVLPPSGGVLAFLRRSGRQTVLVVHNLSAAPGTAQVLSDRNLTPLLVDPGVRRDGAGVSLPPHSSGVWEVR